MFDGIFFSEILLISLLFSLNLFLLLLILSTLFIISSLLFEKSKFSSSLLLNFSSF
jgi:hypothetical protein